MAYDQHVREAQTVAARCAVITLSDTRTAETDKSGRRICQLLEGEHHCVARYRIIRDEPGELHALLTAVLAEPGLDAVLTNGGTGQAGAGWYPTQVSVSGFTTDFDFQLPTSVADGFTFTIQNASKGTYALGGNTSGLGYQFISNSVAVAFNLYQSGVSNAQSIGLYTAGVSPQGSAINLSGTGINLHSGDTFHVNMVYGAGTLTVKLTDKVTAATVTEVFTVNIPASVGANAAYVGFTGSTGGNTAIQNILNWTYGN